MAKSPSTKSVSKTPSAKPKKNAVTFSALFRYATPWDRIGMIIALLAALFNGGVFPLLGILFGQLLNALNEPNFTGETVTVPACFI